MTSNVGAQYKDKMETIGFNQGEAETYEGIKDKALSSLKEHFRPEFLNRLDDIIIFDILSKEAIKEIVNIQIEIIKKRLAEKEITLTVTDHVLELLTKEGYNPQYGARPLKRLIQEKILNPVASMMISNKVLSGGTVVADVTHSTSSGQEGSQFTFDVKKSRNSSRFSTIISKREPVLK